MVIAWWYDNENSPAWTQFPHCILRKKKTLFIIVSTPPSMQWSHPSRMNTNIHTCTCYIRQQRAASFQRLGSTWRGLRTLLNGPQWHQVWLRVGWGGADSSAAPTSASCSPLQVQFFPSQSLLVSGIQTCGLPVTNSPLQPFRPLFPKKQNILRALMHKRMLLLI